MIYYIGNKRIVNGKCFEYTSMEEAIKYLQEQTILSVDTETEGMDFTCKKMIMFQIGDGTNQYVIDTRSESIEPLRSILESKKIIKILHNAKFDYKFIKKWANIELAGIYDTFLVERILHCGKRGPKYGLKDLVLNYLGKELDKEPRNKFVNLQGAPYTDVQIRYGAKDVEYLMQLRELQLPQIAEKK